MDGFGVDSSLGLHWSFLLPEGWRHLQKKPLADVSEFQYVSANREIIRSLKALDASEYLPLSYEAFIDAPARYLTRIYEFIGIESKLDDGLSADVLPLSRTTLDAPSQTKWHRNKTEMHRVIESSQRFYHTQILPFVEQYSAENARIWEDPVGVDD